MSVETAELSDPLLLTLPGVYAPQHDTRLLMSAVAREKIGPGTDVLDVCTGSGALALRAAQMGATVTAVDIGRRAVATARFNALLHRRHITVRRGDLTASIAQRSYDLVLCNPPYVPAPGRRPPRHGAARAWDAGTDGRSVLDRVCADVPAALRPGGVLLMVHSGMCDPATTLRILGRAGLEARVSERAHVPLGPVLLSRLGWLRERNLVKAGTESEELVVIRAERP